EKERRGQIIRHAFVLQLLERRKLDAAISVCKPPANGLPASVNVRDRTVPEFRALEQVERSVPHFNAGSRPPNEPAPHDMRMERAHEYRHPPERNAATDQPVAQLCQHF